MQPTSSSIVQQESESIFNAMEQVCVYNYIVMVYVLTCVLQEIITAFNENFHICCSEDDSTVQSEEEILKWFNTMLSGCGQFKWEKEEEKWLLIKDKLNIASASYMCDNSIV